MSTSSESSTLMFECKTCSRRFPTFQALGGHRTSHQRMIMRGNRQQNNIIRSLLSTKPKKRIHRCPICGMAFSLGQALGGHMRRHKFSESAAHGNSEKKKMTSATKLWGLDLNLPPLENELQLKSLGFGVQFMSDHQDLTVDLLSSFCTT